MPDLNLLRRLAEHTPAPLNGVLELGASTISDIPGLFGGLPGDDLDAWDPEHIRRTLPLLSATFGNYFRGEVHGLDNIPSDQPALFVGNHSGGLMIADTFIFALRFYEHFGPERRFHQLAHNLAARNPGLGLIRRYGVVVASHENARKAFSLGAPVLVYPGGDYETFRPSSHSDQIEFGGRKGFIRLALEEGVPIVPVVSIGGQETALFVTRGERAAKLLGLNHLARVKVLPVSIGPPFGINILDLPGRVPLPSQITIQVLPPVKLDKRFGPDRMYEQVTGQMQDSLTELSEQRSAIPLVG